ncbi:MAG: LysR family transcriptional regulator [Oscillospiraceae bacterium]|nr:LysR family transcriptional regulator [Oscillospiraceae bacterium]
MDIRGLEYFVSTTECMSFTQGAKKCYITQTAMSLHIAKMEEELGFRLFDRGKRKIAMTPAGKLFYEYAKNALNEYHAAVSECRKTAEGVEGSLCVAMVSSLESNMLLPTLRHFQETYPNIQLEIRTMTMDNLAAASHIYGIDVLLLWTNRVVSLQGMDAVRFQACPTGVAMRKRNPLAENEMLTVPMLETEKMVRLGAGQLSARFGDPVVSYLHNNLRARGNYKVASVDEAIMSVELNSAVALLPMKAEAYLPLDMTMRKILCDVDMRQYLTAVHRASSSNQVLRLFLDYLRQTGGEPEES